MKKEVKEKQKWKLDLDNMEYFVNETKGFNFIEFCQCMKAQFDTFKGFKRENPLIMADLVDKIEPLWDNIEELTFEQCITEENAEKRRVFFTSLGPEKIFTDPKMSPELLNEQTISKTRMNWDEDLKEYTKEFEDTYSLYRINGNSLVSGDRLAGMGIDQGRIFWIYAVRCYCTSTGREYWLMVPEDACTRGEEEGKYDAVGAIAWTMQIDIKNPELLYRHGDVILAKFPPEPEFHYENDDPERATEMRPITKEQYLSLLFSET